MTVHQSLAQDHAQLRKQIAALQTALSERSPQLESLFLAFQKDMRAHFRKEDDVYYPRVDGNKQLQDRDLMHSLRNDHAAVVFALESLAIRLRKKVPLDEWKMKFDTMLSVLLPHFDNEEKKLFPEAERILPPAAFQKILDEVNALE